MVERRDVEKERCEGWNIFNGTESPLGSSVRASKVVVVVGVGGCVENEGWYRDQNRHPNGETCSRAESRDGKLARAPKYTEYRGQFEVGDIE